MKIKNCARAACTKNLYIDQIRMNIVNELTKLIIIGAITLFVPENFLEFVL